MISDHRRILLYSSKAKTPNTKKTRFIIVGTTLIVMKCESSGFNYGHSLCSVSHDELTFR